MAQQSSSAANSSIYARGSEWRRWDLHVHTPGTALEDRYDSWEEFVERLRAEKTVVVMGVTDYLSIENYRKLLGEQQQKQLGSIVLLIPNIEFRIGPRTANGHAINVHLLASHAEHCERVDEALSRLSITYETQPYSCTAAGLRKLGAAYKPTLTTDSSRYSEGVNQYKVDPTAFNNWYEGEKWLAANSIVVISGGNDGPSGLTGGGWAAVQEELWRFSDAVFSGNPGNREFWLAEDAANDNGARKLGAPKPCLHGCDAHSLEKLFRPDADRFCWIKGDPTFEGLKQVLYEPKERVHIGLLPPIHHDRSRIRYFVVWVLPSKRLVSLCGFLVGPATNSLSGRVPHSFRLRPLRQPRKEGASALGYAVPPRRPSNLSSPSQTTNPATTTNQTTSPQKNSPKQYI